MLQINGKNVRLVVLTLLIFSVAGCSKPAIVQAIKPTDTHLDCTALKTAYEQNAILNTEQTNFWQNELLAKHHQINKLENDPNAISLGQAVAELHIKNDPTISATMERKTLLSQLMREKQCTSFEPQQKTKSLEKQRSPKKKEPIGEKSKTDGIRFIFS